MINMYKNPIYWIGLLMGCAVIAMFITEIIALCIVAFTWGVVWPYLLKAIVGEDSDK